jgi:hypothetical protein
MSSLRYDMTTRFGAGAVLRKTPLVHLFALPNLPPLPTFGLRILLFCLCRAEDFLPENQRVTFPT